MNRSVMGLIVTAVLLGAAPGYADFNYAEPFSGAPHPRAMAMGNAYVGAGQDLNAVFYNPAGLSYISDMQLLSINGSSLKDVNHNTIALAVPLDKKSSGTLILGYSAYSAGNLQIYQMVNNTPALVGSGQYSNSVFYAGYAGKWGEGLRYGITGKSYRNGLDINGSGSGFSGQATNMDLGLMFNYTPDIRLGLSMQNILENQQVIYNTGSKDKLYRKLVLGLGTTLSSGDQRKINLGVDYEYPMAAGYPGLFHGGVEWWTGENLALRGGADQVATSLGSSGSYGAETRLTAGLGLRFSNIQFDYTYYPDFGTSMDTKHFLALSYFAGDQTPAIKDNPQTTTALSRPTIALESDKTKRPGDPGNSDHAIKLEKNQEIQIAEEDHETVMEAP